MLIDQLNDANIAKEKNRKQQEQYGYLRSAIKNHLSSYANPANRSNYTEETARLAETIIRMSTALIESAERLEKERFEKELQAI
jgi:hypothetical protein